MMARSVFQGRIAAWRRRAAGRGDAIVAMLLLLAALLLGGGGARFPLFEMVVETFGALALGWIVATWARDGHVGQGRAGVVLIALAALVPVIQLIPLPPGVWHALPGRDHAVAVMTAIGAEDNWFPITLDSAATVRAGLSLVPGVALFLLVLRLNERDRLWLVLAICVVALLASLLGIAQVARPAAFSLYETAHRGTAVGFFANRSHNGDFLLIAMLLGAAAMGARFRHAGGAMPRVLTAMFCLLLAFSLVTTTSRMALLLLPAVLAGVAAFLVPRLPRRHRGRWIGGVGGAMVLLGVPVLLLMRGNAVVARTLTRFSDGEGQGRGDFWPDVLYAIGQYLPVGSGLGTFDPVFRSVENLSIVQLTYVVHAHNEYFELLLETGYAGVVLVALFAVCGVWRTVATLRGGHGRMNRQLALAALAGLVVLAAHSVVDYPLRTVSLMTVAALLFALLHPPRPSPA